MWLARYEVDQICGWSDMREIRIDGCLQGD